MVQIRQRESNIELLRLVVMAFIVLHHFIFHGLGQYRFLAFGEDPLLTPLQINYALIADSFLISAVDVFILISGFFSIKIKASGFVRLFGIVSFFSMIGFCNYLYGNGLLGGVIGSILRVIQRGTCVISNQTFWFIQLYFILMFLSGAINKYVEHASKKHLVSTIGFLAFVNIYLGWIHGVGFVKDGYNILNFVMLYLIGRYLRIHYRKNLSKTIDIAIYLSMSVLTAVCALLLYRFGKDIYWVFCYNSPFVLLSAISIFMFFSKLHFNSKIINYMASSCLAIYLMQEGGISLYKQIKESYLQYGACVNFLMMILLFFVISMIAPLIIDKIRLLVFGRAEAWASEKLDSLFFRRWLE